jgi:hypothetical protein
LNCSSKLHVCCEDEDDSEECDDPEEIEFWRDEPTAEGGGKVGVGAAIGGGADVAALMGGRNAADGCGKGKGSGKENGGGGTIRLADGVGGCSRGLCRGDGG